MKREEILSIEEYCAEHKVSHKKRLEELDIPFWHFYKAKKSIEKMIMNRNSLTVIGQAIRFSCFLIKIDTGVVALFSPTHIHNRLP